MLKMRAAKSAKGDSMPAKVGLGQPDITVVQ